jgi:MFS family permease
VFKRYGFRNVLCVGALISSVFIGVNGLFTPDTPEWIIMACLLVGGIIRSTCFTGMNAMVFSDIDEADSSQATAINSVAQQISLATGVAVAGAVLDIAGQFHSGGISLSDFHIAFFVVAIISVLSTFTFFRLPQDAGAEVSGHNAPALAKE